MAYTVEGITKYNKTRKDHISRLCDDRLPEMAQNCKPTQRSVRENASRCWKEDLKLIWALQWLICEERMKENLQF